MLNLYYKLCGFYVCVNLIYCVQIEKIIFYTTERSKIIFEIE
jgi:hypothetical protein